MDEKKMKKLTVGDMSGCNRSGERCHVVRESVGEIAVGEAVLIRFKGDCGDITPWRRYMLEEKHFRDEYDAARLRYTGTFVRVTK